MTTSLVTGGAGFIGSHVAERLRDMGHKVVVLDDLSGGDARNVPQDTIFVRGSVCNVSLVNQLFREYRFDYVFHLAAYAAEGLSHHIRRFNYLNNVVGSVNVINAAVNAGTVRRFVFTSSAAVYGVGGLHVENQTPRPIDPYGIAKYAVEMDLQAAFEVFGLEYTIFRPHNVYGPRQNLNDGYRNVIGIFMRQCLRGESMTIFGDGGQTRQFTYIDDVAPYIAASAEMSDAALSTFNIGADQSATVNGVAAWVAVAIDKHAEKVHLPPRHELVDVVLDHSQFHRCFGPYAATPPWDGIQKMADWARTQQLHEPKPFEEIEIERNLPESWRKLANVD